jgi:primary-amine oxidase
MCRRALALVGLAIPLLLLALASAPGEQTPTQPSPMRPVTTSAPPAQAKVIEQSFPPNGVMETAWKVEWDTARGWGLFIKSAWFKRGPNDEWMQVLGDARVADIFVPYQPGVPRFWDTAYNFKLSVVSAADAGANGKLLTSMNGDAEEPCVVQELRERGVIWKNDYGVRRGHSMVLWGCLHGVNYRYLMEYGFQDDGSITFRVGATGRNLNGREWVSHMHNYYWRVDINLDGKDHNSALVMETVEPKDGSNKMASETFHKPFNGGKEGWVDWDPAKFTMLRVINTQKKNIRGENYAYDVIPLRHGTSRHFGNNEECTHHDYWVTKAKPDELSYRGIPTYCDDEDITDTDIVIWYGTAMFHEPRSEDGIMENGQWVGATHVGWSGFTLRPNNFFDRAPLYPNPKAPPPGPTKKKEKG